MAIKDRGVYRQALRVPIDSLIVGQGFRYVFVGVIVTAVYLLTTATLNDVLGIPVQLALIGSFTAATGAHFTLQRMFVWARASQYMLNIRKQMGRYALVMSCEYVVTAAATSVLPGALGVPAVVIYLGVPSVLTILNFIIFRYRIFHGAD